MTKQSSSNLRPVAVSYYNPETINDQVSHLRHCRLDVPILLLERALLSPLKNRITPQCQNDQITIRTGQSLDFAGDRIGKSLLQTGEADFLKTF